MENKEKIKKLIDSLSNGIERLTERLDSPTHQTYSYEEIIDDLKIVLEETK